MLHMGNCHVILRGICGRVLSFFPLDRRRKNCLELLLFVQGHRGSEWELQEFNLCLSPKPVLNLTLKNGILSVIGSSTH